MNNTYTGNNINKTIAVFGSTGSIGTQTLDVAEHLGMSVTALTAFDNEKLLEAQCRRFSVKKCYIGEHKYSSLKVLLADTGCEIITGSEGLNELAYGCECDVFYNSLMGMRGLAPTLAAIKGKKKRIALSNKETLVAGGDLVKAAIKEYGTELIPVDSEHSAIFQCLQGVKRKELDKILLTASGGPFFGKSAAELDKVTPADALKHPNWSMGAKITIDSSTMMNKGLEVIEAVHLFDVTPDKIQVVVHRESVIHSMIELCDGAILAQLGAPDMRLCIQYAATYPERKPGNIRKLDLFSLGTLSFSKPDNENFPALEMAYRAIKKGGNVPCAMNGANEEAVALFLKGKIKYRDIYCLTDEAAEKCLFKADPSFEDIMETDREAREYVLSHYEKL